jgi:rod shape-determining protein MreC
MRTASRSRIDALLLVALLFGQLLIMSASARNTEGASYLERGVTQASGPLIGVTRAVGGRVHGVLGWFREMRTARAENVRLREEVVRLRGEVDRTKEQANENRRLRRLLGMREDLVPRSIGASVITTTLTRQTRMILLDRGEESGVRSDQAVVAWGGAVGRVVFAGKRFSKVRLLTDPNSGVAGIVQRSRAAGMVVGRGEGGLEMAYVPKYADVVAGDRVITSGLDGVFPKGFGIGTVSLVADTAGVSKTIRLSAELDFSALEEVLILLEPSGSALLNAPEPEAGP